MAGSIKGSSSSGEALKAVICACCMALAGCPAPAAMAADDFRVAANGVGSAVAVQAEAVLKVPLATIWETLTDYERLPQFIPGIRSSRVLGRRGPAAIVEQGGEAAFLFFRFPIHVVVESAEYPPALITLQVVRGNLRQLSGRYQIDKGERPNEHVLRWTGVIEPDTSLPAFITVPVMRARITDQFAGMVHEIKRRHEARVPKDPAPDEK